MNRRLYVIIDLAHFTSQPKPPITDRDSEFDHLPLMAHRGRHEQVEVVHLLADPAAAVLHNPQLCQTPLGALLHALLRSLHRLDRRLLLLHGLDGEHHQQASEEPQLKSLSTFL